MFQATLKDRFSIEGIGVHSGMKCSVTVSPADEDHGIVFSHSGAFIIANYRNVSSTAMCTKLSDSDGNSVKTVEHLVGALYGMGISNAVVDVCGGEVPILDGSALPFIEKIQEVGVREQKKKSKVLRILKKIKVTENAKYEEINPAEDFSINVTCDFESKGLKTIPEHFSFTRDDFCKNIAPARTFGFISDVEYIRKNNLALGASMENTVVYDAGGIPMNPEGLRLTNESVKHKLLDIIGDFSMSQCRIQGRLDCFCPSHRLNNMILRLIFSNSENYEII